MILIFHFLLIWYCPEEVHIYLYDSIFKTFVVQGEGTGMGVNRKKEEW